MCSPLWWCFQFWIITGSCVGPLLSCWWQCCLWRLTAVWVGQSRPAENSCRVFPGPWLCVCCDLWHIVRSTCSRCTPSWFCLVCDGQKVPLIYKKGLHTMKSLIFKYMLQGFLVHFPELCSYRHDPILEHFHHPLKIPVATCSHSPVPPPAPGNRGSTSCLYWFAFYGHVVWFHSSEMSR